MNAVVAGRRIDARAPRVVRRTHPQELGMWVFIASEVMFFGVLFALYLAARLRHGAAFAAASRELTLSLGVLNTAILLTSSLTMALAARAARLRLLQTGGRWLLATGVLGLAFLSVKAMEYLHDAHARLLPQALALPAGPDHVGIEYFYLCYYVMTGAHALHLLIGIALVLLWSARLARTASHAPWRPIELVGLYWHLVDIVWIFLFPLFYLVSRT